MISLCSWIRHILLLIWQKIFGRVLLEFWKRWQLGLVSTPVIRWFVDVDAFVSWVAWNFGLSRVYWLPHVLPGNLDVIEGGIRCVTVKGGCEVDCSLWRRVSWVKGRCFRNSGGWYLLCTNILTSLWCGSLERDTKVSSHYVRCRYSEGRWGEHCIWEPGLGWDIGGHDRTEISKGWVEHWGVVDRSWHSWARTRGPVGSLRLLGRPRHVLVWTERPADRLRCDWRVDRGEEDRLRHDWRLTSRHYWLWHLGVVDSPSEFGSWLGSLGWGWEGTWIDKSGLTTCLTCSWRRRGGDWDLG